MRIIIILCCLMLALNADADSFTDTGNSSCCYFSADGQMALVSELHFIRFDRYKESLPVYGWYKSGKNMPNGYIAFSNDSAYFFRYTVSAPVIDSAFSSQVFLTHYHFTVQGIDITDSVGIEIHSTFLEKQNTIKLLRLDQVTKTTGWKFRAADTRFYNYFIRWIYKGNVLFADTLLNVYADKKLLLEGLREKQKKTWYDPKDGWLRGLGGYGTRVYMDKEHWRFFIRAKYDTSNPTVVICVSCANTNSDVQQSHAVDKVSEFIELRVLGKF